MKRFAGIKNNHISLISNSPFDSDLFSLEVPADLDHVSSIDLISDYIIKNNTFQSKNGKKKAANLKIALVSNWKMSCGISTYSENLYPGLIKKIGDYQLFVEKNETPTSDFNTIGNKTSIKIIACWKRGDPLSELAKEIKKYNPDIVLIQHEFGIFPNARYWLSLLSQLSEYRVIVEMHSIYPTHQDKSIIEAAVPEFIVHLDEAKNALIKKGITNKISVIPHACYDLNENKLWNIYKSNHTFIQMGFGFKYKNFEHAIIACNILKKKYNDVFLTILFSQSEFNKVGHQLYYNELIELIEKLNLHDHISIIRGFQSDQIIDSFLRTNKVAVFPYQSDPQSLVFGASGAARLAMSANIPVITSFIPHFSDLPTIKVKTPEEMANNLDHLFSDKKLVNSQVIKQNKFIAENCWENIIEKYIKLFENKNT